MPDIAIPDKTVRRWTGPYLGKYQGALFRTFNVDLDRIEGSVVLSRKMFINADTQDTNTDTISNIEAFLRTDADCESRFWALSRNGPLYKADSAGAVGVLPDTWKTDALANSPLDARDFAVFEVDSLGDTSRQQLFVTRDSDISVLNDTGNRAWTANWWTGAPGGTHAADSSLDTGVPHPICYFPFRRIMIVGDGNKVHTISRATDTSNETTTPKRLILPTDLEINYIFVTSNRAWILARNTQGGKGAIIEWDGFSETYNQLHSAYSDRPLTGVNYQETPIVINSRGAILEYSGSGFAPMIRNGQIISFPVFEDDFNGLVGNIGGTLNQPMIRPRGMTITENGLIHVLVRQSNRDHERQVGGVWCLNPEKGRLYNKYGPGDTTDTAFGQQLLEDVGAIQALPSGISYPFIASGQYTGNGNSKNVMWLSLQDDTYIKRGYIVTQFVLSEQASDLWQNLWARFKAFVSAGGQITVKASGTRTLTNSARRPLSAFITWVNGTSFTVTLNASDDQLAVGDEVEVVASLHSGVCAHITAISGAHGALQTMTIDETVVASTEQSTARFDRFKKLGSVSDTSTYKSSFPIGIDSPFVRFKVELRGNIEEMELYDLLVHSENQSYIKQ